MDLFVKFVCLDMQSSRMDLVPYDFTFDYINILNQNNLKIIHNSRESDLAPEWFSEKTLTIDALFLNIY